MAERRTESSPSDRGLVDKGHQVLDMHLELFEPGFIQYLIVVPFNGKYAGHKVMIMREDPNHPLRERHPLDITIDVRSEGEDDKMEYHFSYFGAREKKIATACEDAPEGELDIESLSRGLREYAIYDSPHHIEGHPLRSSAPKSK